MIFTDLFESDREPYQLAIDKLEARRIEDLEMKMDDLAARAKESKDPKHVAALRLAFAKAKAERDDYYKLRPTVAEHGGGGGGPAQWHAYVRSHRTDEQDVEEGWSDKFVAQRTGGPRTPYGVYIDGKQWKEFPTDDQARAVARKLEAKFKADGSNKKVSYAPAESVTKKDTDEGTMDQATNNPSGAKFGGYYKGTQVGAPRPGQGFGAESVQHEGAKVDRMVKHIEKSERATGKSKKDAEAIAWATANKRGMLDNVNKKDEGMNFMEWAVAQGSRFANFAGNPAVYAAAKQAFVAEGMSNALSNITRRMAQPVSAKTIIKNREQKKKTIKTQNFAEDEDVSEEKQKGVDGKACWDGYKRMGTKQKGGKTVDNCVKMEEDAESQVNENYDYMGGHCHVMALALKKAHPDWQIRAHVGWSNDDEAEDDDYRVDHVYAVAPDGSAYDSRGRFASEEQLVGPDTTGGVDTQYVDMDLAEIKRLVKRGELKPFTSQDVAKTAQLINQKQGVAEDWQKANKKDKTDGMSKKAVNAYRRENPGSKLKTAVTTKPSKLKKGSKPAKRRKSYCSRSKGQMKMHSISCAKTPDKAICKARRRWNCESQEQFDAMLREAVEKGTLQPGQYYVWEISFDDGTKKKIKVTKDTFDPKAYYAKQNKVVVNVDYNWDPISA